MVDDCGGQTDDDGEEGMDDESSDPDDEDDEGVDRDNEGGDDDLKRTAADLMHEHELSAEVPFPLTKKHKTGGVLV